MSTIVREVDLNNPVEYLRHQLAVIPVQHMVETGRSFDEFVKNIPKTLYEAGVLPGIHMHKVHGSDFDGFVFLTVNGHVVVATVHRRGKERLSIAAAAKAEMTYHLTAYRWGGRHIHTLMAELAQAEIPKGSYVFHGEFRSMAPLPISERSH